MFEATDRSAALMPADKPRYFMGIGDPEGILEVIEAGVDMFDCVLPTRTARTGSALDVGGAPQPAERALRPRRGAARRATATARRARASRGPTCGTSSTRTSSSGLRLLSLHNLRFLIS